MVIYRVQNSKGDGPYRKYVMKGLPPIINNILDNHSKFSGRPTPIDDFGRHPNINEICGFITISQALSWFGRPLLKCLAKYDFYLRQVEVKEITAVSETQCLAIKKG